MGARCLKQLPQLVTEWLHVRAGGNTRTRTATGSNLGCQGMQ